MPLNLARPDLDNVRLGSSTRLAGFCAVAFLSACGGHATTASQQSETAPTVQQSRPVATQRDPEQQLPALARGLLPPSSQGSLDKDDLAVEDCGLSPTYPCISAFFTLRKAPTTGSARLALLRTQARQSGWRVVQVKSFGTGLSLELVRGRFHARYAFGRGANPGDEIVGLDIYGPPNVLPRPSSAERRRWSVAKRRYVARMDSICVQTLGGMKKAADIAPAISTAAQKLRALTPPSAEADAIKPFLRSLTNLSEAVHEAERTKGDEGLGAAVVVAGHARRFERAAARYGLTRCTFH
jgi:hypothetical protein